VGIEADAFALADGLDGDDVPDIFGDNVGDEEIDFAGGVDEAAGSSGFDSVASLGVEGGGFDLHAKESAVEFDDGIVAIAVSPREADGEAEMGGASEEGGFGGFSATLAGGLGDGVNGDESWDGLLRVGCLLGHKFWKRKKDAAGLQRLKDVCLVRSIGWSSGPGRENANGADPEGLRRCFDSIQPLYHNA
jgi:hypothetical protein